MVLSMSGASAMTEAKLEFPEVIGKVVAELFVVEDPEFGKEVLVRFSDDTQLSIAVGVRQVIDARYCSEETPDLPITHRQTS
jgi:hypothetical protein